jgi:hypothetical protein
VAIVGDDVAVHRGRRNRIAERVADPGEGGQAPPTFGGAVDEALASPLAISVRR